MRLIQETSDINKYLASSETIDFTDPDIQKIALNLSNQTKDEIELIKIAYEFVRDNISHSMDINADIVTVKASEVLKYKHGLCFAKSHLIAAILRFLGVPTGFCYQKLEFDEGLVLHGLNAVYIKNLDNWIRLDARGNKDGINAQFNVDMEILAYYPKRNGEIDFPVIYVEPNKMIVEILGRSKNFTEAMENIINTKCL